MYFRSIKKFQGDVSLSDSLDGDGDGGSLSILDTIHVDDNMLEELDTRDCCAKVRQCVGRCLDEREAMVISLRYGLNNDQPLTQREIAAKCGIARSYVSRRAYCKRRDTVRPCLKNVKTAVFPPYRVKNLKYATL